MKKLFTFVVAMALVTMSFAQLVINTTTTVQNPPADRSDWYGYYATSHGVFVMAGGSEYCLRIAEGAIPAGDTITRIRFFHTDSDHVTGNNVPVFNNETYTIRFYTGTTYDASTKNITPGTLALSHNYTVPEGEGPGIKFVDLGSDYFIMPASGDITVSIFAPEAAAVGLCPTDDDCVDKSFAYFSDEASAGYHHWAFGDEETGTFTNRPLMLSVYYQDGQPYQPKSDFAALLYDPWDGSTNPDPVESYTVQYFDDSLYYWGEGTNYGVDDAIGFYTMSLYLDGPEPFYFIERSSLNPEEGVADTMGVNWTWINWKGGLCSVGEDIPELQEMGFNFPLTLCLNVTYESLASYGGVDPNPDNNTYCVTIDYFDNIKEATNDLMVYPNPACNEIHIGNVAGAQVSIYNIAGQEVMNIMNADANATINVSNLTEGIYVVRVVNGNEVSTSKVNIIR